MLPYPILAFILSLAILPQLSQAQQASGHELKILNTINAARKDPKGFATKYETKIKDASPRYWNYLQNAKPLTALTWDPGLWQMGKEVVENNNLNPSYKSKNQNCGYSAGRGMNTSGIDPIEFAIENLSNITNPNIEHFSIYCKADKEYYCYWRMNCKGTRFKFNFTDAVDTSKVDFNKINTAKNANYLSAAEKQMVQEINFARVYPQVYTKLVAQHLAQMSEDWDGLDWDQYQAGMELIRELERMQPLKALQPSDCLQKAAKIHAADCQRRGFLDHEGSDGSMPWDRVKKQCKQMDGNENLVGGNHYEARRSHMALLIDGGIATRGHRDNALNPGWLYVGVAQVKVGEQRGFVQKFAR